MEPTRHTFLSPTRLWEVNGVYDGNTEIHRNLGSTLDLIGRDPMYGGHSDVGIRNMLFMLTMSMRPKFTLEIGGHIGTAAITTASALALNDFGHHYVMEPNKEFADRLRHYVGEARLEKRVTIVEQFSDSETAKNDLRKIAPFQIIFVDARHTYDAAKHDLELALELCENDGLIILHDTSEAATSYDETGKGGVRQALIDVTSAQGYPRIFFEWPLWVNKTGAALLVKQRI